MYQSQIKRADEHPVEVEKNENASMDTETELNQSCRIGSQVLRGSEKPLVVLHRQHILLTLREYIRTQAAGKVLPSL